MNNKPLIIHHGRYHLRSLSAKGPAIGRASRAEIITIEGKSYGRRVSARISRSTCAFRSSSRSGLSEESVGARPAGFRRRPLLLGEGRDHKDPGRLGRGVSFDPAAHFQAVETRHAEVQDEQIGTEGSDLEQALVAV